MNLRRIRELKAYKFRLYPSAEQEKKLNRQLELCRDMYNAFLEQRILAHKMGGEHRLQLSAGPDTGTEESLSRTREHPFTGVAGRYTKSGTCI